MLNIEQGNRLEQLAESLCDRLKESSRDPLLRQVVVVSNPGMGRWLKQQMAGRHGIAANLDLPLPATFFWQVLRAWLPNEEISPFDRDTLVWRILSVLPDLLEEEAFAEPSRYLKDDDSGLRRFQLAERIADLFDQYLVFRPKLVLAWEEGREEAGWQSRLWRAITREERSHRARLLRKLLSAMEAPPAAPEQLPETLFFFGLNSLPPVYLGILDRLARHRQGHLYHLNPCKEYWADIRDERSQARHEDPQEAFLALGNPLLASMGHVGQVFMDQLLGLEADVQDRYQEPEGESLLARIQRDILRLVDGRLAPEPLPEESWPSLQFHGTHSRLREVQVLHDNLLRCLEELDGLTPREILVMAPDMAAYEPFVEAVFGTAQGARQIPFSIGDRSGGGANPLGEALRWLLKLPASRFPASEVLALLEVDAVQHRFGLEGGALERIREWVRESGIRWGLDATHRRELGLPPADGLHSWQFGLRRLFLGFVTPVEGQPRLYPDGTVPWLDIEGGELRWAGILETVLERLDRWRQRLRQPCSPAQWRETLASLFEDFFDPREDEERALIQLLVHRLDEVVRQAGQGGFDEELPLAVMAQMLEATLDDAGVAGGFLQGGVTFSNLLPMRALPYRVICLLGMNHSDFPRYRKPPSFDLMARKPLRTDRDRRRDDRYLFLETLVSARDCLLISWLSRDARTDQEKLPAGVVSELMDYLDGSVTLEDGKASARLFTQHRLQPFSPAYFQERQTGLFSYDDAWVPEGETGAPQPFLVAAAAQNEPVTLVELDELLRFFDNPARAFLEGTLSMRLPGEEELPEDREPFSLDGLQRWQLNDYLMQQCIEGHSLESAGQRLAGEGRLPQGLPGKVVEARLLQRVTGLHERLAPLLEAQPWREPLELDIGLTLEDEEGGIRLAGRVRRYTGKGVFDFRVGHLRGQDRLNLWIRHLAVAVEAGGAEESLFVAEDAGCRFLAIDREAAMEPLSLLLMLYRQGQRVPLKFFPRTSWQYAEAGKEWEEVWHGREYASIPGEGENAAYHLVFRDQEPLDEAFRELAEAVYGPLIEYLEEL